MRSLSSASLNSCVQGNYACGKPRIGKWLGKSHGNLVITVQIMATMQQNPFSSQSAGDPLERLRFVPNPLRSFEGYCSDSSIARKGSVGLCPHIGDHWRNLSYIARRGIPRFRENTLATFYEVLLIGKTPSPRKKCLIHIWET